MTARTNKEVEEIFLSDCLMNNFNEIDLYLAQSVQYWQYNFFVLSDYPTFNGNTKLIELLQSIDDNQLAAYQTTPSLLYPVLKQVIPELLNIEASLFALNKLSDDCDDNIPFWFKKGIKGKKWTQIDRFSNTIKCSLPILEWCAGKGHLGRLIHHKTGVKVSAIEWSADLCKQGQQLANQQGIQQDFIEANVLSGEADEYLNQQLHVIALHACGDLHVRLINRAKKLFTKKITISPCCYHLTEHDIYQAVSKHVRQSSHLLALSPLSKQDLKLAVAQQSSLKERQSQLNDQEVWWRLSFDCLQKSLLKTDKYLNVPSFPKTLLSASFKEFAQWVVTYKQLDINLSHYSDNALTIYLVQGRERLNRLRRVELVTQFFRRPLELWLAYDRALSLQEAGYQVQISTFCDAHVTPRNLLIQASLKYSNTAQ